MWIRIPGDGHKYVEITPAQLRAGVMAQRAARVKYAIKVEEDQEEGA